MVGAGGWGSHHVLAACGGYHPDSFEFGFCGVGGLAGRMDQSSTLATKPIFESCLAQVAGRRAGRSAAASGGAAAGCAQSRAARAWFFGFLLLPVTKVVGTHAIMGNLGKYRGMDGREN